MELKQGRNLSYRIKGLLGGLMGDGSYINTDQLLVVNYHGTQKKFLDNFKIHLDYWESHFDIISPDQIGNYLQLGSDRPKLLLTFDDGLKNNLFAISEMESRGLRGLFFIVPAFIEDGSRSYYIQNIRPIINPSIDRKPEDFVPMTWSEISDIIQNGNAIGNHSMTHQLSFDMNDQQLYHEIIESKDVIEARLNRIQSIIHFCSPNNSMEVLSKNAIEIIKSNYSFHFSTINGINSSIHPNEHNLIYRINVESFWGLRQVKYSISSLENQRWRDKRESFTLQYYE